MTNSIRILVIDDEELIRESICAFLEDEGFLVDAASTAEEALDKLGSIQYDVCITDYTLPGIDGESLVLLAHDIAPQTRFILHTGAGFTPSDELLKTGFSRDDIMAKPIIRLELLTEKIISLAGEKGMPE